MSIGLHILYGVMGSGKTNFAVNELLDKTTYQKFEILFLFAPVAFYTHRKAEHYI